MTKTWNSILRTISIQLFESSANHCLRFLYEIFDSSANQVVVLVIGREFHHLRVCSLDGLVVVSLILVRSMTLGRRRNIDKNSRRSYHSPSTVYLGLSVMFNMRILT